MMKPITENLNVSPDENDIIDELKSIIGSWGNTSEKQDIIELINHYTNDKSLYEDVRAFGEVDWDKYRESGYKGRVMDHRKEVIFPDKMFYSMVEMLVNEKELEEWEQINSFYLRHDAIRPIVKLFGKTISDKLTDGMLNKLYWAVVDNYDGIKDGEIDEFKYLTLRDLKVYTVNLAEHMTESRDYFWTVNVAAYDEHDINEETIAEDDYYEPWEHNYTIENDEIVDRGGIDVDSVRIEKILKEQDNSPSFTKPRDNTSEGEVPEKVIDKLDIIIMERIIKDHSVRELDNLSQTHWQELHELDNILKLFGKRGDLKLAKQYIQFIWDNSVYNTANSNTDLQKYIGDKLPPLKQFTFKVKWTNINTYFMSGDIVVYDTDYDVAACDVLNYIYDYNILNEKTEYEDNDSEGRVLVASKIGNKKVYDDDDDANDKYDPYKNC